MPNGRMHKDNKEKKEEVKEVSWIEKNCPGTMTPTQYAQMIVQNPHNFQGGNGPEIQKAKDYLDQ